MEKPNPSSSHWFNTDTRTHFISNWVLSPLSLSNFHTHSRSVFHSLVVVHFIYICCSCCDICVFVAMLDNTRSRQEKMFNFSFIEPPSGILLPTVLNIFLHFLLFRCHFQFVCLLLCMCLFYWSFLFGVVDVIIFIFFDLEIFERNDAQFVIDFLENNTIHTYKHTHAQCILTHLQVCN